MESSVHGMCPCVLVLGTLAVGVFDTLTAGHVAVRNARQNPAGACEPPSFRVTVRPYGACRVPTAGKGRADRWSGTQLERQALGLGSLGSGQRSRKRRFRQISARGWEGTEKQW